MRRSPVLVERIHARGALRARRNVEAASTSPLLSCLRGRVAGVRLTGDADVLRESCTGEQGDGMSDLKLSELGGLDTELRQRIERYAHSQGCEAAAVLPVALDVGLQALEARGRRGLGEDEDAVLAEAIRALEQVPDDPGFGLIGRAGAASETARRAP